MKNLEDLFEHQLQDLYSAETQIIAALPEMEKKASNAKLKKAFKEHLEETKGQQERLKKACDKLGVNPKGEKCKAIEGIINEAKDFISEGADKEVMDAGLIANAQRVEHYEIAGYGTAFHYAKMLGHAEIAELLQATLEEEKDADEKLNDLAIEKINEAAL
ncbi:YciE/YciF ferroxidase family protein [Catalinimonas niigatensis]|uniref:YciE/YciF ferroxidase family protein n=1 Tax=Catalinimonas niigatensis TaxID=1397264 RepID=UPI002666F251|nr:ferritin-like domain-containing protein [Catalinimonas niigatensis]WPP49373.1 ferritin-like domain-containing protein [Catalinimonas niigatensis]